MTMYTLSFFTRRPSYIIYLKLKGSKKDEIPFVHIQIIFFFFFLERFSVLTRFDFFNILEEILVKKTAPRKFEHEKIIFFFFFFLNFFSFSFSPSFIFMLCVAGTQRFFVFLFVCSFPLSFSGGTEW